MTTHPSTVSVARVDQVVSLIPVDRARASCVFLCWVVLTVAGLVWWSIDPRAIFFLAGCAACVVVSFPLVLGRQYDLLSPWTLVLVGAYIGYGLRGLFISLGVDGTRTIEQLYLLGHQPNFFVGPSGLFLLGLTTFTAGFIVSSNRRRKLGVGPQRLSAFSEARLAFVVPVLAVVGLTAFYMYAQAFGGVSLDRLSGKRASISGLTLSSSYQSNGEWRVVNSFSAIALWLQIAHYSHKKVPHGLGTARGWWIAVLFVNAALLPMYANTRIDVAFIVVTALVIEFCLSGQGVKWRVLLTGVVVAMAITVLLTALRDSDQGTVTGEETFASHTVDAFVLTRSFSDIPTSSHIIEAVPQVLPYANGETIASWLAAPIPRALWPEKPIISAGPTVGILIYGNHRAGVPPGLVAESYWNFGWTGLILLPGLCGWFIAALYRRLAPGARRSPTAAVLLAVLAVRPGFDLASNSIGYTLFQLVQVSVLIFPALWLVTRQSSGSVLHRGVRKSVRPSRRYVATRSP